MMDVPGRDDPVGDGGARDTGSRPITAALDEAVVASDPLIEIRRWFAEAVAAAGDAPDHEPMAATLATVDGDRTPDARTVLLRGVDERGVWWFTNRRSTKGRQLAANPAAAIVVQWPGLGRQVRMQGGVSFLPDEESDAYFAARPRAAQLGAWASMQSQPIVDRATLDAQMAACERRFVGRSVPRPGHWGGYLLQPQVVELWQSRPGRLHDRLRFVRDSEGWSLQRLQP